MDLEIAMATDMTTTVVSVRGALDMASAPYLRMVLLDRVDERPDELILNVHGLRLADASSIRMLLFVARRAEFHGGRLRVVRANQLVTTALEIVGADKTLGLYDQRPAPNLTRSATPVDLVALRGRRDHWPVASVELLSRIAELPVDDPARRELRREVIELCLPEAVRLARRYARFGEPSADLNQVAAIGLIKAVDGFDAGHGVDFAAYATPTVVGELKRHLRDRGWSIRVPRRIQDLRHAVGQGRDEFSRSFGRSPTAAELADFLRLDVHDVAEAVAATSAYRPSSLDEPASRALSASVGDLIGSDDSAFELVEDRETLLILMQGLPEREQRILGLRFYGNLSQTEIAAEVGLSQMQVSRLLRSSLRQLREGMTRLD